MGDVELNDKASGIMNLETLILDWKERAKFETSSRTHTNFPRIGIEIGCHVLTFNSNVPQSGFKLTNWSPPLRYFTYESNVMIVT